MDKNTAIARANEFKNQVNYKNEAKRYTILCYAYFCLVYEKLSFEKLDSLYESKLSNLEPLKIPYKYIKDETRRRKLLLDFPDFFKISGDINGEKYDFFVELRHK